MASEDDEKYVPWQVVRELDRLGGRVDKLSEKVDTVGSSLVSQTVFEMNRTEQGRRIGNIEETLRTQNRMAWTAIVMGIGVPILVALLLINLGLK